MSDMILDILNKEEAKSVDRIIAELRAKDVNHVKHDYVIDRLWDLIAEGKAIHAGDWTYALPEYKGDKHV